MPHPTEGVLRRLLDEPAGVADQDRAHLAGCPECLGTLAAVRDDAGLVGVALSTRAAGEVDVAAAWRRHSTAAPVPAEGRAARPRTSRSPSLLRRPAVAALAVVVALTGASAAAANDWLQVFKTERIAPVSITTADLVALPDLSGYGELSLTGDPDVHAVPDVATAAAQTGLDVPEVTDLPQGITGAPVIQVGRQASATFTFSAERAARAAAQAGDRLPPVPAGLDGTAVRLVAGPGVAQVWTSDSGAPGLVVGRAVAPTAFSSGAPFEVVRDYLLSLPSLPPELSAQLRSFAADGSTLPLPVSADQVTSKQVSVDGSPATLLTSEDRSLAAVVWVDGGIVTVVAGSLDDSEVLDVARDLG